MPPRHWSSLHQNQTVSVASLALPSAPELSLRLRFSEPSIRFMFMLFMAFIFAVLRVVVIVDGDGKEREEDSSNLFCLEVREIISVAGSRRGFAAQSAMLLPFVPVAAAACDSLLLLPFDATEIGGYCGSLGLWAFQGPAGRVSAGT